MRQDKGESMTTTYKTQGELAYPVNDLTAARDFLRERGTKMHEYIYPDEAARGVHSVTWDLINDHQWEVTLIADFRLSPVQLEQLSNWISGQNSDGLGESFEQQQFAEQPYDDDDTEYDTSSFDWETNQCVLELVQ